MEKYNHKEVDKKWQDAWKSAGVYKTTEDADKEKFYILDMFPYPSGDGLHMGHTESYTASDIMYRFKKMSGFNVLHPQGFDSFGLPAENFAIKTGAHPAKTTKANSDNYLQQMRMLGLGHDLDHLVYTSAPEYYKWTQWLFGKFFENGLVEQKVDTINWCPSCNTGLANEQVEQGACERCKAEIEQREVKGWFFKITDFAEELIDDLDKVDWPETTKKNQRAWIGKSEGAKINFALKGGDGEIEVFTTRPDTLFGATYMVLAPEHELVQNSKFKIQNSNEVLDYVKKAKNKTEMERMEEKEKTGVELKGIKAINPANNEEIPVYIADYVLAGYGTGAIMAVPAHDERDFEFAKKFGIEVKQVIVPEFGTKNKQAIKKRGGCAIVFDPKQQKYAMLRRSDGVVAFYSGGANEGEDLHDCVLRELREESGLHNFDIVESIGQADVHYYNSNKKQRVCGEALCLLTILKDADRLALQLEEHEKEFEHIWLTPKEILKNWKEYSQGDGTYDHWRWFLNQAVGRTIELGHDTTNDECEFIQCASVGSGVLINSGKFDGMSSEEAKKAITEFAGGEMTTNYRLRDWSLSRQRYWGCPIPMVYSESGEAKYVGDENLPWILPEDVDFIPTGEAPLTKSKELKDRAEKLFGKGWAPEVDTMDTFVDSAWYFLRYPDTENTEEFCSEEKLKRWMPVDLYIGGAEHTYMHLLYARFFTKAMHKIGLIDFDEPFLQLRHQGMVLDKSGVKMSKSKGNVVNPNEMVERFGADAVRLHMMFVGPLEDDVMWDEDNVTGISRFLDKMWRVQRNIQDTPNEKVTKELHKTIKKIGEDIQDTKYNTAIAQMMIFINTVEKEKSITKSDFESFLKVLSPFAPHITQELWSKLGNESFLINEDWPSYDEELIKDDTVTIAIQVNGKVRAEIEVGADASEDEVKVLALANEAVDKWISQTGNGKIKRFIYITGRMANIVVL